MPHRWTFAQNLVVRFTLTRCGGRSVTLSTERMVDQRSPNLVESACRSQVPEKEPEGARPFPLRLDSASTPPRIRRSHGTPSTHTHTRGYAHSTPVCTEIELSLTLCIWYIAGTANVYWAYVGDPVFTRWDHWGHWGHWGQ